MDFLTKIRNKVRMKTKNLVGFPESKPLYPGEMHLEYHNFTGPFTKLNKRLDRLDMPVNNIDKCSMIHDMEYNEIKNDNIVDREKKAALVRGADERAIECYNNYPNEHGYLRAKTGIAAKIAAEKLISDSVQPNFILHGGGVYKEHYKKGKYLQI